MQNLRSPLVPRNTPALKAWRRELQAGTRTVTTFDWLWRAACEEMNTLEAPTPAVAASYFRNARRIVRDAKKGRAA